jgi:O-methyltransferase
VKRFEGYANLRVIKGVIPDVLDDGCPDKISFLHLDMNAAKAEIGALEVLFEKMVPGGFVVLDDFGHSRHRNQFTAERAWFKAHGHEVLELPTGQGPPRQALALVTPTGLEPVSPA